MSLNAISCKYVLLIIRLRYILPYPTLSHDCPAARREERQKQPHTPLGAEEHVDDPVYTSVADSVQSCNEILIVFTKCHGFNQPAVMSSLDLYHKN
nr:MAG TPA: hypothetical protein [Microviridae sp.]